MSTLDHHLPKARYPALAVTPINLVPACADCNRAKTDSIAKTREEQSLHPYFDDVEDESWLEAEVVEGAPAALRFYVRPPDTWDELKIGRVRYHFRLFNLAALYASHAAEELVGIRYRLTTLLDCGGGAGAVREHLQEEAESRGAIKANSWQAAVYKALANCDWYCDGGFKLQA